MTCVVSSGVNRTVRSVCSSLPTPTRRVAELVWRDPNAPDTEPLDALQLNTVGIRNHHMMRVLERVAAAFNDADIPLLAMKGAALHLLLYAHLNDRPMDDLDLLVHPEDLDRASHLLKTLGGVCGEPLVQENFCPCFHYEIEFSIGEVYPVKIDLHVRPFRPLRYARLVPTNALWANAQCIPIGRATILVAGVEDMLIHLTAHAAIHGCSQRKWLQDIKRWLAMHQHDIDWYKFLCTTKAWRLTLPVREGLRAVVREVGAECPAYVISELSYHRISIQDRLVLWQSQRDADHPSAHVLINVLCTPGLRYSVAYLLAVALPSRQHMGSWYRRRHGGWYASALLLRWLRPVLCCIPGFRRLFEERCRETVTQ